MSTSRAEETEYLTGIVRRLYPAYRENPISSYSALRPLIAESGRSATSTSREHRIWETSDGVLHIAGGKYTTYREMSEELVDTLLREIAPGRDLPCRTAQTPIPVASPPPEPASRTRMAVEREYARRLEDVIYVSSYEGYERPLDADWLLPIALTMGEMLGWDKRTRSRRTSARAHPRRRLITRRSKNLPADPRTLRRVGRR